MDIVTKKQLSLLIRLAEIDKHFAKEERDLIHRIADKKNFPPEELEKLMEEPEPVDSLGALSLDQKLDYLMTSVELIFADHKIYDSELLFSKGIAIKLGFRKDVIDFMMENFNKIAASEIREIAVRDYY